MSLERARKHQNTNLKTQGIPKVKSPNSKVREVLDIAALDLGICL
jgi:hypothetical protein